MREALLLPVWRWEGNDTPAQELHLLIFRELDGTQVKFSLLLAPAPSPGAGAGAGALPANAALLD